ncbi:MAG: hypothetical protein ACR2KT_04040 [Methylocella sp.]
MKEFIRTGIDHQERGATSGVDAAQTRGLPIKQKTMSVVNAMRGHLAEFGIAAAKGIGRAGEPIAKAASDATLPEAAKAALKVLVQQIETIHASIGNLDKEIAFVHAQREKSCLLAAILGAGKRAAAAIAAGMPDPGVFKSGRGFFRLA